MPEREGASTLEISVSDVNDNSPRFEHDLYAISIVENLPTGFSVVQVAAQDADEVSNQDTLESLKLYYLYCTVIALCIDF